MGTYFFFKILSALFDYLLLKKNIGDRRNFDPVFILPGKMCHFSWSILDIIKKKNDHRICYSVIPCISITCNHSLKSKVKNVQLICWHLLNFNHLNVLMTLFLLKNKVRTSKWIKVQYESLFIIERE